jgi:hypothetical protein
LRQTLRDEYSRAIKILDAEYKHAPTSLDDVIKTWENLHILLKKYEHLLDGTLEGFNMEAHWGSVWNQAWCSGSICHTERQKCVQP